MPPGNKGTVPTGYNTFHIKNELPVQTPLQFSSDQAQISNEKEQKNRAEEIRKAIKGIQQYYTKDRVSKGTFE